MKFILQTGLILILSYLLASWLPWWGFILVAFVVSLAFRLKEGAAFLSGLLALVLLWGGMAFFLNQQNEGLLASRMGELFGGLSPILLVLVTALLGGLLAGLASWSGVLATKMLAGNPKT